MHKHQLLKITITGLVVLLLHGIFTLIGFYERFWWFDIPMHFIGGVAIAIATYFLLQHFEQRNLMHINSKVLYFLIVIAIVGLSASAWEIFEFYIDILAHAEMQMSLKDTLKDIGVGLLGGSIITSLITLKNGK